MTDKKETTALAVVDNPRSPILMRPIAAVEEIISARAEVAAAILKVMEPGVDVIRVPGTKSDVLSKAGAEKANFVMGCAPRYSVATSEIDHDRVNHYHDKYKGPLTSTGLYRFVVSCEIVRSHDDVVVGSGLGSCSTMEGKYISRPRDCENTALKMACKRAYVAATLNAFCLSDRLTQDLEDFDGSESRDPRAGPPPPPPKVGPPKKPAPPPPVLDTPEGEALDVVHATMGSFDGAVEVSDLRYEGKTLHETLQSALGDKIGDRTRWGLKLWYARRQAAIEGKPWRAPTDDGAAMLDLLASSRARAAMETHAVEREESKPTETAPLEGEVVE